MRYLKTGIVLLSFFFLSLTGLIGCTSNSKYNALQNDYQTLLTKYETLAVEHADLQSAHTKMESEFDKIQSELGNLQNEYDSLENDSNLLKAENDGLKTTIKDTQSSLSAEQANNKALNDKLAILEYEYKLTSQELVDLKEVYPAKLFASKTKLIDWLAADDISERQVNDAVTAYQNALELQDRALRDGYIINANIVLSGTTKTYYSIYCTALTGENSLYWWPVNTDSVEYMIVDVEDIKWTVGG